MSTQTHHDVPPGSVVTIGPDRLTRVADVMAIIRDALLILFMVAAIVLGGSVYHGLSQLGGTPTVEPVPDSGECLGEVPC